jgi:hypothetical protein
MNQLIVKRLLLATSLSAAAFLASCDEPRPPESIEIQTEVPVATAAEDAAADAAAEAEVPAAAAAPAPVDTLPPEQRTSEQTVQPESDTLFY